ncbi:MAG: 4-hydroxy-tetrahydrodipicolinate synthase [Bacteroidales bacterium]|nr:4-hydroxy-tetrahydrodipicolinate synthase [Bacteroidales bacterium]
MTDSISRFKGLGVALITPFRPSGEVDYPRLESLVDRMVCNRVDYLLALGTTSEYPTLNPQERDDVLRCITETNGGRLPVMYGLGGPNTQMMIHQLSRVERLAVDAVLSVTPYYNKPSQAGLLAHYKALAEHCPLPMFLYNVPGRTATNIQAETVLRVVEACPNVVGIKEASGSMKQILYLLNHKPDNFLVISGDDMLTLPLMAAGMDGLISVMANAFPAEVSNMVHLAAADQFIKARLYHDKLFDLAQACFKEGNPCGIKAVLYEQGRIDNVLRLPLVSVSEELQQKIHDLLNL